tara:strand:- start:422 stop:709 length:288 start_codon:yes stop_codon:yes gene_type:complete
MNILFSINHPAHVHFFLFEITKNKQFLHEGEVLLDWLITNASPEEKFKCRGYNYIWKNTIFLQQKNEPNTIVTTFVSEAFLHAYRLTKKDRGLNN